MIKISNAHDVYTLANYRYTYILVSKLREISLFTAMFKRIICPIDFSDHSAQAIAAAVNIAQPNGSELVILYTYRLVGIEHTDIHDKISFRQYREELATKKMHEMVMQYPQLSDIRYTFLTEIGFLRDRVFLAVKKYSIDLVVLSEDIQVRLKEKWGTSEEDLLNQLHCPILLVPSAIGDSSKLAKAW